MRKHRKGKKNIAEPAVGSPFAGAYWHLQRLAKRRRLFVLFDGDSRAPRLTFFETIWGVALLDCWPMSRLWAYVPPPAHSKKRGGNGRSESACRLSCLSATTGFEGGRTMTSPNTKTVADSRPPSEPSGRPKFRPVPDGLGQFLTALFAPKN